MDAIDAFVTFVRRVLISERADRFIALTETDKGQRKILASLDHKFEPGIKSAAIVQKGNEIVWEQPCYVFHRSTGFGAHFVTIWDAYAQLSDKDGWLIVAADGSSGIYRPEACWDGEMQLAGSR